MSPGVASFRRTLRAVDDPAPQRANAAPGRRTHGSDRAPSLRNLLVPIYLDESSSATIDYAAHLARSHGARIHLVHVVPTNEIHLLRSVYRPGENGGANEAYADLIARRALKSIAHERLFDLTTRVITQHDGDPVRGVLTAAERCRADMIILPTQSRTGLFRLIARGVTERIVRESRCPVLVTQQKVKTPFERILCPIDLHGQHPQAIEQARRLAEGGGGTVHLLHVIPSSKVLLSRAVYRQEPGDEGNFVRAATAAREALLALANDRLCGVSYVIDVRMSSHPTKTILEVERDHHADVVVMVTRGLAGLVRRIFGGVTERVIRGAACPVLTVRA